MILIKGSFCGGWDRQQMFAQHRGIGRDLVRRAEADIINHREQSAFDRERDQDFPSKSVFAHFKPTVSRGEADRVHLGIH